AKRFGLKFLPGADPGASIALGTLEVHPVDLVGAYGAIANQGVLMPRTTILSIVDSEGKQVYPDPKNKPKGTPVVSKQSAYLMTDILTSNTQPSENPYWGKF